MNNKIKNVFFFLLMFYVTFPFVFEFQHLLQDLIFLTGCILVIVFNFKFLFKRVPIFSPINVGLILIFGLLSIFSIAYPIYLGTFDISYFRGIYFTSLQLVISHLALIIVFIRFYDEKATFYLLSKFYILSCLFYLAITFLLIMFPTIKDMWLSVLYISEIDIGHLMKPQYSTRVGIDGFAGFRQTLRFALGTILNSFLIVKNLNNKNKLPLLYFISLVFLLLGTFLYGRIGSVVAIFTLLILLLLFLNYQKTINLGLVLIVSLFFSFLLLIVLSFISEPIRIWFQWAFELVISFVQTGEFSSKSTDILFEDMYFIPGLKEFLVGEGLYTDPVSGGYFGGTDVGFLRSLLFFGIIPTIGNYFIPIVIIFVIKKNLSLNDKMSSNLLFLLLLILFLVFEIKGGIYHYLVPYLIPFYIISNYQNNNTTVKTK